LESWVGRHCPASKEGRIEERGWDLQLAGARSGEGQGDAPSRSVALTVQLGDTVIGVEERPSGRPAPRRLAPPPHEPGNIPALAALFLGPLSILLVFLSAGGFFLALPCGIAAIVLGTIGIRNVDRRRATSYRGSARLGRITGWIGTILSILALIVFIVVATLLDVTADGADSVSGLIDAIRDEIDKVDVPDVNAPDGTAPEGNSQDAPR
jgi:hypothetical protein